MANATLRKESLGSINGFSRTPGAAAFAFKRGTKIGHEIQHAKDQGAQLVRSRPVGIDPYVTLISGEARRQDTLPLEICENALC